jgi:hypothetical protein
MRATFLIALIACLAPQQSLARNTPSASTGNNLLQACRSDKGSIDWWFCVGYLEGAHSAMGMDSAVGKAALGNCPPDGVTKGQLFDITVQYLDRHPETRHLPAVALIAKAWAGAFPCRP